MRTQFSKIALAATLGLALAFTFTACVYQSQAEKEKFREDIRVYNLMLDSLRVIYERDTVVMMTIGNKAYKTVMIGETVLMAENLNMEVGNSVCYENKAENCDRCGRLYDWKTAIKACPSGWKLTAPWGYYSSKVLLDESRQKVLTTSFGYYFGSTGVELRAKSGWSNNGNGEDKHSFSALPCGAFYYDDMGSIKGTVVVTDNNFRDYGSSAYFWESTSPGRTIANRGHYMKLSSNRLSNEQANIGSMFSVRCVLDVDYHLKNRIQPK